MTDFQPQTSPSATPGEQTSSLPHLRHMSATAGVGTQEYVAINNVAIVAVLLGAATVLVFFSDFLFVIPVVAIACAIIAWRQIRQSNGTQTGTLLALAGVALSLLIGGGILVKKVATAMAVKADEQAISKRIDEFGKLLAEGKYAQAHGLMSERFKSRVNGQQFADTFELLSKQPGVGTFKSATWNNRALFEEGASGKLSMVGTHVVFQQSPEPMRWDIRLSESGGQWWIDSIPVFPEEKKPKR